MMSRVLIAACLLSAEAADSQYQTYMKNAGGSQSGSGENYQQYMKSYAGGQNGDYQQYMKKYAGGGNGNYQQYMNKYAGGHSGGYQQYMEKYTGADHQPGNYQQYMSKYAGGQGGDYQQYMQKYAGGQGGNYQQYMSKYAGGSQGGSQSSGNFDSSMELVEKTPTKSSDGTDTLNLAATTDGKQATGTNSQQNYQKYMDKYAGSYEKYMKQYAGSYQKYANYQQNKECESSKGEKVASAKDAKTRDELNEWYTGAQQKVKCFVPDEYNEYASKDLDRQYKDRLVELENPAPATTGGKSPFLANQGGQSPFLADDAVELMEKPKMAEKTQTAAKTFLAKSDVDATDANIEKVAQSEAATNLALFADQVKSDPVTVVAACSLGVAFACFVFFAVRHRQIVQLPVAQLG